VSRFEAPHVQFSAEFQILRVQIAANFFRVKESNRDGRGELEYLASVSCTNKTKPFTEKVSFVDVNIELTPYRVLLLVYSVMS